MSELSALSRCSNAELKFMKMFSAIDPDLTLTRKKLFCSASCEGETMPKRETDLPTSRNRPAE